MAPRRKVLRIKIDDQGNLQVNARQVPGDARTIVAELEGLAELVGGDVTALLVEKHDPKAEHAHTHDGQHVHAHG